MFSILILFLNFLKIGGFSAKFCILNGNFSTAKLQYFVSPNNFQSMTGTTPLRGTLA